jgi:chromosomal replication initiation ATPase DnaA
MNNLIDVKLTQLSLDFKSQVYMGRDDYMVSSCNNEAYEMIDNWPNWMVHGLIIYGPKGCGKTHLANLFVEKVCSVTQRIGEISIIEASKINMRTLNRISNENRSIVVDNFSPKSNMEAIFHLFNMYNTEGRYMLFTSETAPSRMHLPLKDLQSRLNMLPSIEIKEPDDLMLQALIVKLFNDKQIIISPEILNYILMNAQRSFAYIEELVDEIDKVSLAYQRAVNYQIIKKSMDIIAQRSYKEPDLFDEY